jgi:hypothetical protein
VAVITSFPERLYFLAFRAAGTVELTAFPPVRENRRRRKDQCATAEHMLTAAANTATELHGQDECIALCDRRAVSQLPGRFDPGDPAACPQCRSLAA